MTRTVMFAFCATLISGTAGADPLLLDLPKVTVREGRALERLQASEDKVHCKLRFIQASKEGPSDKALEKYKKAIPGYKSLKLLAEASLTIPHDQTRQAPVPGHGKVSVKFIEKVLEGKERVRLRLLVKAPPKMRKAVLQVSNGGTGFIVRAKKGRALAIALTCRAK